MNMKFAAVCQECVERRLSVPGLCLGVPGKGSARRCKWLIIKPLDTGRALKIRVSGVQFRPCTITRKQSVTNDTFRRFEVHSPQCITRKRRKFLNPIMRLFPLSGLAQCRSRVPKSHAVDANIMRRSPEPDC